MSTITYEAKARITRRAFDLLGEIWLICKPPSKTKSKIINDVMCFLDETPFYTVEDAAFVKMKAMSPFVTDEWYLALCGRFNRGSGFKLFTHEDSFEYKAYSAKHYKLPGADDRCFSSRFAAASNTPVDKASLETILAKYQMPDKRFEMTLGIGPADKWFVPAVITSAYIGLYMTGDADMPYIPLVGDFIQYLQLRQ